MRIKLTKIACLMLGLAITLICTETTCFSKKITVKIPNLVPRFPDVQQGLWHENNFDVTRLEADSSPQLDGLLISTKSSIPFDREQWRTRVDWRQMMLPQLASSQSLVGSSKSKIHQLLDRPVPPPESQGLEPLEDCELYTLQGPAPCAHFAAFLDLRYSGDVVTAYRIIGQGSGNLQK